MSSSVRPVRIFMRYMNKESDAFLSSLNLECSDLKRWKRSWNWSRVRPVSIFKSTSDLSFSAEGKKSWLAKIQTNYQTSPLRERCQRPRPRPLVFFSTRANIFFCTHGHWQLWSEDLYLPWAISSVGFDSDRNKSTISSICAAVNALFSFATVISRQIEKSRWKSHALDVSGIKNRFDFMIWHRIGRGIRCKSFGYSTVHDGTQHLVDEIRARLIFRVIVPNNWVLPGFFFRKSHRAWKNVPVENYFQNPYRSFSLQYFLSEHKFFTDWLIAQSAP